MIILFFVNQFAGIQNNEMINLHNHIDIEDKCYNSSLSGPDIFNLPKIQHTNYSSHQFKEKI